MSDRTLLELAAKAAGIKALRDPHGVWRDCTGFDPALNIFAGESWNPLESDADAFRLAVKLNLHITNGEEFAWASSQRFDVSEPFAGDSFAATRLAIVRCAAAIGKTLNAN
jgi:hypothetical protein